MVWINNPLTPYIHEFLIQIACSVLYKDTTEGYMLRANNVYGLQIMVISLLW